MPNNEYVNQVKNLIDRIFANTGVDKDVTADDLKDIREYIDEKLNAIDE